MPVSDGSAGADSTDAHCGVLVAGACADVVGAAGVDGFGDVTGGGALPGNGVGLGTGVCAGGGVVCAASADAASITPATIPVSLGHD